MNLCGDEGEVKADADPISDNVMATRNVLEVRIRGRRREGHIFVIDGLDTLPGESRYRINRTKCSTGTILAST